MRQITLTMDPFGEVYGGADFDSEAVERSPITSTSATLTYNKSGTPVVQTPAFDCLHSWKIKLFLSADRHSLLLALVAEQHRRIRENEGNYLVTLNDEARPFVEPAPRSREGGDLLTTADPLILKYFAQFSVVLAIVEVVQVAGRKGVDPYWQVELSATEIATAATADPSWTFDTAGLDAQMQAQYGTSLGFLKLHNNFGSVIGTYQPTN